MALNENIGNKHPGDPIKSDDWNALAAETRRLDTQKLDTTGGTISGPLTVLGAISSPTVGDQIVHGNEDAWSYSTDQVEYQPALARDLTFESATSMLLVGHCSAITNPGSGLQMVLGVDDRQLHQVNKNSAISWGMAFHSGTARGEVSQPLVTMGICTVQAGTHTFKLLVRSVNPGQPVQLNGPALFLLQVGAG